MGIAGNGQESLGIASVAEIRGAGKIGRFGKKGEQLLLEEWSFLSSIENVKGGVLQSVAMHQILQYGQIVGGGG